LFTRDVGIVMLSRNERESVKLLQKSKYAYKNLPAWMKERAPASLTNHQQKMVFANDSMIESLPSREDPARGSAVYLVVVDEWAFLENAEEAWASIEPVADVGGRVIGLSTANGSGEFFHNFWIKATTGVSDFKPMFYPWSANTERDESWYESKQRSMMPWMLHQEYPTSAEEAFIRSGNPVFDIDMLSRACEIFDPRRGYLVTSPDTPKSPTFRSSEEGEFAVWALPNAVGTYAIGADVAEGLEHGDYSSAHVVEHKTGELVAHWHGRIDPDAFGDILAQIGYFYNTSLLGVEVNNHGLTTCTRLKYLSYPRLYYRKVLDERSISQGRKIGWRTSVSTKPLMIDELNMAIRDEDLMVPCALTLAELRTYVRDEKGKMHGSPYDDRVMSLAVAQQMRRHLSTSEYKMPEDDYWTAQWWLRQAMEGDKTEKLPLGYYNRRKTVEM
jgi:hypothetical protein